MIQFSCLKQPCLYSAFLLTLLPTKIRKEANDEYTDTPTGIRSCKSERKGIPSGEAVSVQITDVKVIVTCPGRNYVFVKVLTDEPGLYGIGEGTLNGSETIVAEAIRHMSH